MKAYKTLEIYRVNHGTIGLSKEQAARRKHNLEPVDGDIYRIVGPLCFKAGEVVRLNGNQIGKADLPRLEEVKEEKKSEPEPQEESPKPAKRGRAAAKK